MGGKGKLWKGKNLGMLLAPQINEVKGYHNKPFVSSRCLIATVLRELRETMAICSPSLIRC